MIYINKDINIEKIKYILCDFDRTISVSNSPTSWSIFSMCHHIPMGFKVETAQLFDWYRPIELDHALSIEEKKFHMMVWPCKQVLLFPKYGITYKDYIEICKNDNRIMLRPDFREFVHDMYELSIPVHIISGGLFEPIKCKLESEDALLSNVEIISNHVSHDNKGAITGISGNIITSMNKDEVLSISSDEQGLLFGDLPSDKLMGKNKKTVNVGFVHHDSEIDVFNEEFDITLTGDSSFTDVSKMLIKK